MNTQANGFVSEMNAIHNAIIGQKTVAALRENHFDAEYFDSVDDAITKITSFIKPSHKVAFGGSQTVRQLGLAVKIAGMNAKILDHNEDGLSLEKKVEIMREQQICDVFICSSNAITLNGELYNVDGNGNRISALIFGPKKVIVVAGINKICADESAAWQRIKFQAAPVNMIRLSRQTPCTVQGTCMDCSQPLRGCNAYLVLRKKPSMTDISVYVINIPLGF